MLCVTNSKQDVIIKLKMNKNITLIAGIIAVAYVIYSFFGNSEYADIFGFEVNIWMFRLFWSVLAVGILYSYYKKRKAME
jgi:hypothetical protein